MTREEAIKVCTREKDCVQSALDACADGGHYVSPDGIITALDYVDALDMAISALREQPRWISVEERLPEDCVQVLACTKHGKAFSAHRENGKWRVSGSVKITHWMPLPEPPEEK